MQMTGVPALNSSSSSRQAGDSRQSGSAIWRSLAHYCQLVHLSSQGSTASDCMTSGGIRCPDTLTSGTPQHATRVTTAFPYTQLLAHLDCDADFKRHHWPSSCLLSLLVSLDEFTACCYRLHTVSSLSTIQRTHVLLNAVLGCGCPRRLDCDVWRTVGNGPQFQLCDS
jgi:hypothetical protein